MYAEGVLTLMEDGVAEIDSVDDIFEETAILAKNQNQFVSYISKSSPDNVNNICQIMVPVNGKLLNSCQIH